MGKLEHTGQGRRRRGGHRGQDPAVLKTAGDDPPEIWIFQYLFLEWYKNYISKHFKNKAAEIGGETKFWG